MNNKYSTAEQLTWPKNWENKRASEAKYFVQRVVKPVVCWVLCVGVVTLCGYLWVMGY